MVWYSHLFKNFPICCDHTVRGFGLVYKAEVDVFLEFSCFFYDPADVGSLMSGSSALGCLKRVYFLCSDGMEGSMEGTACSRTGAVCETRAFPYHLCV